MGDWIPSPETLWRRAAAPRASPAFSFTFCPPGPPVAPGRPPTKAPAAAPPTPELAPAFLRLEPRGQTLELRSFPAGATRTKPHTNSRSEAAAGDVLRTGPIVDVGSLLLQPTADQNPYTPKRPHSAQRVHFMPSSVLSLDGQLLAPRGKLSLRSARRFRRHLPADGQGDGWDLGPHCRRRVSLRQSFLCQSGLVLSVRHFPNQVEKTSTVNRTNHDIFVVVEKTTDGVSRHSSKQADEVTTHDLGGGPRKHRVTPVRRN